jgi:hypothetical protein
MRKVLTAFLAVAALGIPAATPTAASASAAVTRPATVQAAASQVLRGGLTKGVTPYNNPPYQCYVERDDHAIIGVCIDDEGIDPATGSRQFKAEAAIRNFSDHTIVVDFSLYFDPGGQFLQSCHVVVAAHDRKGCGSGVAPYTPPVSARAHIEWNGGGRPESHDISSPQYVQ